MPEFFDSYRFISRRLATMHVARHHYSTVMPRITKACIGGYVGQRLMGTMTLGWGTRPLHTIQKLFPGLTSDDYLELGKFCLSDEMPPNSESQFLSRAIRMVHEEFPHVLLLYSWADGILGKPGYVYQAANFWYGGYIWTECYLDADGLRIHPRTLQGMTSHGEGLGPRDYQTTTDLGLTRWRGKQFRYCWPLCDKRTWRHLRQSSSVEWRQYDYPKDADCLWREQVALGEYRDRNAIPWTGTDYPPENGPQMQLFERAPGGRVTRASRDGGSTPTRTLH
ncbi:MAG: hypothetical protein U9Q79_07890 [Candidatus Hydrogenedentes bacterium]|nr:hypothetical protein [Candidatus Hydrogenedentota bacterium]